MLHYGEHPSAFGNKPWQQVSKQYCVPGYLELRSNNWDTPPGFRAEETNERRLRVFGSPAEKPGGIAAQWLALHRMGI